MNDKTKVTVKRTRRTPAEMQAAREQGSKQTGSRPSREATEARARSKRIPFGKIQSKMSIDQVTLDKLKANGMVARWINDENHGQRIKSAQQGGYEFVTAEGTTVGNKAVDEDRKVTKLVGSNKDGSAKYAYLMAIHQDFHDEDKQAKEAENRKVDDSIRAGTPKGSQSLNVDSDKASVQVKDIKYTP